MSEGRDLAEGFQDVVRSNGDDVLIHTQTCVEWGLEHENCKGCPSSLGCNKAVALMMASLTPMLYTPKSFEDFESMQRSMRDRLDNILNARTAEELQLITR